MPPETPLTDITKIEDDDVTHTPNNTIPSPSPSRPSRVTPLGLSDLIFAPQANHNFNTILHSLKERNLSLYNRLRSIALDADFVASLSTSSLYSARLLVANERCGSWYVPPSLKRGSAYFKSTDGHAGQWSFSLRRLNLHLLTLIGRCDGVILVDSTRRGKRMPDALSKTVPIWCAVLNHVLFPELGRAKSKAGTQRTDEKEGENEEAEGDPHDLFTPPNVVPASEHAQMAAKIPEFADELRTLSLDWKKLRARLRKPLRPVWVTPESAAGLYDFYDPTWEYQSIHEESDLEYANGSPTPVQLFKNFHPVICCTSSRRVVGDAEMGGGGGYIQGAGDDTENWARGLTPVVFWNNREVLLRTPEADLPALVDKLVSDAITNGEMGTYTSERKGREKEEHGTVWNLGRGVRIGALPTANIGPSERNKENEIGAIACSHGQEQHGEKRDGHRNQPRNQEFVSIITPPKHAKHDFCIINIHGAISPQETWRKSSVRMDIGLGKHKTASRNLRVALPVICDFVEQFLQARWPSPALVPSRPAWFHIGCGKDRDIAVGVALALLCKIFPSDENDSSEEDEGEVRQGNHSDTGCVRITQTERNMSRGIRAEGGRTMVMNKTAIKTRLGRLIMRHPEANPSRSTLQSVNSFLLG